MILSDERGALNAGSLTLGLAALASVFAAFTVTGVSGRVLRNAPDQFRLAVIFVLVASILLAVSALPNTSGLHDLAFALAGLGVLLVGLLLGVAAAAKSASIAERPAVTAELVDDGLHLKVKATAANRASDTRLVILIDGLTVEKRGATTTFAQQNLDQTYVGPDGEGKFDVPVDMRIPAGRFDAVGIRSWTERDPKSGTGGETQDRPCRSYPSEISSLTNRRDRRGLSEAGTGCLILPLPHIPVSPRLSLTWAGEGNKAERLLLGVATDNAPTRRNDERACPEAEPACTPGEGAVRVAVQIKGELRGSAAAADEQSRRPATRLLYRALLRPDGNGHLAFAAQLPIADKFRRICAEARFMRRGAGFIRGTGCPADPTSIGVTARTLIELRPPGAKLGN
jgi:hypothetical protein